MIHLIEKTGVSYYLAPDDWDISLPNPFTDDGSYSEQWSCMYVDDDIGHRVGRLNSVYCVTFSTRQPHIDANIFDFISYENLHNRIVIVSAPFWTDLTSSINNVADKYSDNNIIREYDRRFVLHTTIDEAWELIQNDGMLKSYSRLLREGTTLDGIDMRNSISFYRDEPKDYHDYIMFGSIGVENNVVYRKYNKIGIRLYFDAHKIIQDGLAVRDGRHPLKVYDYVSLIPYLKRVIKPSDIDPQSKMTHDQFSEIADKMFCDSVNK